MTSFGRSLTRRVQREAVVLGERLEVHAAPCCSGRRALFQPLTCIAPSLERSCDLSGDHAARGRPSCSMPRPVQVGAGAVGAVEGEHARASSSSMRDAAVRAGVVLDEAAVVLAADHRRRSPGPSASCSAVSSESVRRWWMSAAHDEAVDHDLDACASASCPARARRSRRTISPSTRTRDEALLARRSSNSFSYSPLRPRTTGEQHLDACVPSGSAMIWSTIWSTVCWRDFPAAVRAVRHARRARRAGAGSRESRSPCPRSSAGCGWWSSGRSRWRGKGRRCSPRPAFPSGPGTGGRRRKGDST